ncbi:MAG: hypothetical protein DWQ08_11090, partial [Proteobacteria bacterium]
AVEIWESLASGGHVLSQYNIGLMYENGTGVPRRADLAFFWYRLAAVNGHEGAQYNLGGLYFRGQGVERSVDQAVHWWRESANAGNPNAAFNLAVVLMGDGQDKSSVEAAMIRFRQAADAGHPQAAELLESLGQEVELPRSLFFGVPPEVPAIVELTEQPPTPRIESEGSPVRNSNDANITGEARSTAADPSTVLQDGRVWLGLQPDDDYTVEVSPFYEPEVAYWYLRKWGFDGPGAVLADSDSYRIVLGAFSTRTMANGFLKRLKKLVPEVRHKHPKVVRFKLLKR